MLRTLSQTRDYTFWQRLAAIAVFTLLTVVSAQFKFGSPVPYTLQVLVVLLSGMVLGTRDGALSQMAYIGLIAANMPVDANQLGSAALTGFTAGYLLAFVPAAALSGWLVEMSNGSGWQRWLAGVAGVAIIYAIGLPVFKAFFPSEITWGRAWELSVQQFIVFDLVKAMVAAAMTESGRRLLLRVLNPVQE